MSLVNLIERGIIKMEEKDVNSIASAVTGALAKLNADTAAKENLKEPEKSETFKCSECGGDITGGIAYCHACGCELEWGD